MFDSFNSVRQFRLLALVACSMLIACEGEAQQQEEVQSTGLQTSTETSISNDTVEDAPVAPPVRAPNIGLPDATGRYRTIVDRKKPRQLALVFISTYSIDKLDDTKLKALSKDGFAIFFLDQTGSKKTDLVRQLYINKFEGAEVYFDNEGTVATRYSVDELPTIVVIDKNGIYTQRIPP